MAIDRVISEYEYRFAEYEYEYEYEFKHENEHECSRRCRLNPSRGRIPARFILRTGFVEKRLNSLAGDALELGDRVESFAEF
jgi:hypothetical protein